MGGSLTQPRRVQEDGPLGCKLLLTGKKRGLARERRRLIKSAVKGSSLTVLHAVDTG
eukprot:gene15124-20354_t